MGRKSSIKRLPEAIQEEIGRLFRSGATLDEILAHLAAMPGHGGTAPVSRSALGRHVQGLEEYAAMLGQSREMATALVDRIGDEPDSKVARLNYETLHAIFMKFLAPNPDGTLRQLDPEQFQLLGRFMKDMASFKKLDVEAIKLIEQRAAARAKAEAADAATTVAEEQGISAKTVQAIRAQILGIAQPAPA